MKKVLVLQHEDVETPGLLGETLATQGWSLETIHSNSGARVPKNLDASAGLVVMGGPQGVYEQDKFPYLKDELRLIEHALKARKPVIGICLGSQLIAAALGSAVAPGPQKEIGWYPVRLSLAAQDDPLWNGLPTQFTPLHWHGDVFDLPKGAVQIASSDLTACQAFAYEKFAYGCLFHLEITEPMVREWAVRFEQELKTNPQSAGKILQKAQKNVEMAHTVGRRVFERWAGLLAAGKPLQAASGPSEN